MPYSKIADLPKSVTDNLPTHAQEIFLAAFNSAFKEYNGDEQRSFKIAWGAVKNSYEKVDGKWQAIKKQIESSKKDRAIEILENYGQAWNSVRPVARV